MDTSADDSSRGRAGYRRSAGSPRGEARRRELLDRVTDDLAANGLVDFSLRRAARAAGTTHKVLLYHFPPGVSGKTLMLTGKLPPRLFGLFMQQLRLRMARRLPISFRWLTKRGDAATARWVKKVLRPETRRDTVRMLRAVAADGDVLLAAAEGLPSFDRPALVVWASEDRVMPPEHGRRLAGLLPQGRLVEIDDSYTLIPLDQPAQLAQAIREFTHTAATP